MKKLLIFSNNNLKIKSIFYDILNRLFSENITKDIPIKAALNYIENHFSDCDIKNHELAQICNISEVYFRKLFRKTMGTTPKQYILELRIKKAKQLLETDNLTVTDISEKCGFANVYHLCKTFKNITGVTPTTFRNQAVERGI